MKKIIQLILVISFLLLFLMSPSLSKNLADDNDLADINSEEKVQI